MILENNDEDYLRFREDQKKIQIYNPNKKFKNKIFYFSFRNDISVKNYTSLLKFHNKLELILKDSNHVNIKEELEFLYQSIEFDPILYKKPKNYILFNERKREICMKLCQICDDLNIEGKASLDRITKNYNLINHNEPLKKSTVFKYLRTSKYSFKKCSIRNPILCSDDYYLRKLYVIDVLMSKINDDYIVISIDETPLNTIEHSDYYWSSNNCRQLFKKRRKKTGFNMIMAVEIDKISNYRIEKGSNNSEIFWTFVNETLKILELKPGYRDKMKSGKILLFLDNASIHYGVKIRDKILKFDIEILYNVPYESNFNPIERVFRSIKTTIRSDKFSDLDEVKSSYFSAIRLLSEFDILRAWKSSVKDMFKSLKISSLN